MGVILTSCATCRTLTSSLKTLRGRSSSALFCIFHSRKPNAVSIISRKCIMFIIKATNRKRKPFMPLLYVNLHWFVHQQSIKDNTIRYNKIPGE